MSEKQCQYCKKNIDEKATKCYHCLTDVRTIPWYRRSNDWFWQAAAGLSLILSISGVTGRYVFTKYIEWRHKDFAIITGQIIADPSPYFRDKLKRGDTIAYLYMTNNGYSLGIVYPKLTCLFSKIENRRIMELSLYMDAPIRVKSDEVGAVPLKFEDKSYVDYASIELAKANWSFRESDVVDIGSCFIDWRDKYRNSSRLYITDDDSKSVIVSRFDP